MGAGQASASPLPDASRLMSAPASAWAELGSRLRTIGLTADYADEVMKPHGGFIDQFLIPLMRSRAERMSEPRAVALRFLVLGDAVSEEQASSALGPTLLALTRNAGLVGEKPGGLSTNFPLSVGRQHYVFADDMSLGGDAVMGLGETTETLAAVSTPSAPIRQALDLGCGSGAGALAIAHRCDRVIATDLNPRALVIGRLNSAVNGVSNIEFRGGDMYEPVRGENFDVILSQPPYVAHSPGKPATMYMDGGERGDEITLRVIGGAASHLAPGGRAVVLSDWLSIDREPVIGRIRRVLPESGGSVLHVFSKSDLDTYCVRYCWFGSSGRGDKYVESLLAMRRHLEDVGATAVEQALTVVTRGPGWTTEREIPLASWTSLKSGAIDRMLAVEQLVSRGAGALVQARVRLVRGASITRKFDSELMENPRLSINCPSESLAGTAEMNEQGWRMMLALERSASVREAIAALAAANGAPLDHVAQRVLPAVAQALRKGLLEIV